MSARAAHRPPRRRPGRRRQAGRPRRPPGPLAQRADPGRPSSARCSAAAPTPSGPASSTASTRTPAACSSSPAATTAHAALQAQVKRREVERVYLALAGGRLASRTGTIDAPIGRASRQRHRMAVSGAASRQARTHFDVLELLRRRDLPRGAAGDRPHPPDPRPLRRDRPPAGRRPDLRRRGPLRARAPVPARPPARLRPPGQRRARSSFRSELPADLAAALEAARAA